MELTTTELYAVEFVAATSSPTIPRQTRSAAKRYPHRIPRLLLDRHITATDSDLLYKQSLRRCNPATQVQLIDEGFLSRDISVQDLFLNRCAFHYAYTKHYLKREWKTVSS